MQQQHHDDNATVDSWNDAATQATAATVALVPVHPDDGGPVYYQCPKHPQSGRYDTPHQYCTACEQDFADRRRQLQQQRDEVQEQLQAMTGGLSDLNQAMQQLKPPEQPPQSSRPPPPPQPPTNLPPRHPGSWNGTSTTGPPAPATPETPSLFGSTPSFMNAGNLNSTNNLSSLDALVQQLQRMQLLQDWMLMQKDQECAQLKQGLELARHEIQELRVENALLTEKLAQQEERMQHELKLIKLAALQQHKVSPKATTHHRSLVVANHQPSPNQQAAGRMAAIPPPPPPSPSSSRSESAAPQKTTTATWDPFESGEFHAAQSIASTVSTAEAENKSPVAAGIQKFGRVTPSPTVKRDLKLKLPVDDDQDEKKDVRDASVSSKSSSKSSKETSSKEQEEEVLSKEDEPQQQEFVVVDEPPKPQEQAPPEVPTTSLSKDIQELQQGLEELDHSLQSVQGIPREFVIDPMAQETVPLGEQITGATHLASVHQLQNKGHLASLAHQQALVQQQPKKHTRNHSDISDVGMGDQTDAWSYQQNTSSNNNSEDLADVVVNPKETIETPAAALTMSNISPIKPTTAAAAASNTTKRIISFPDDIASVGQTVASSTYGEDRQNVSNKSILDPYGDRGQYTGVILRSTGMPHGSGKMIYQEDKRTYDGEWRHGRWHGYGRATFANGDNYVGEYRFDQRHGRGRYEWHDGRVYDGLFREDKRHGKGQFEWPDGAVYEGEFCNGQREGQGKYTFSDGGCYEGSWKDGRYSGYGTCSWEDGRCYKGEWLNGMAHGKGVETFSDGSIRHDGLWIEDEPVPNNS